jgi:hypothetical protein
MNAHTHTHTHTHTCTQTYMCDLPSFQLRILNSNSHPLTFSNKSSNWNFGFKFSFVQMRVTRSCLISYREFRFQIVFYYVSCSHAHAWFPAYWKKTKWIQVRVCCFSYGDWCLLSKWTVWICFTFQLNQSLHSNSINLYIVPESNQNLHKNVLTCVWFVSYADGNLHVCNIAGWRSGESCQPDERMCALHTSRPCMWRMQIRKTKK